MQRSICGIIACRQTDIVGFRHDGYMAECIMPQGYAPHPHLVKTPEGQYFAWEDDDDCDCCGDDRSDPDRCYVTWPVTEAEAKEYLGKG